MTTCISCLRSMLRPLSAFARPYRQQGAPVPGLGVHIPSAPLPLSLFALSCSLLDQARAVRRTVGCRQPPSQRAWIGFVASLERYRRRQASLHTSIQTLGQVLPPGLAQGVAYLPRHMMLEGDASDASRVLSRQRRPRCPMCTPIHRPCISRGHRHAGVSKPPRQLFRIVRARPRMCGWPDRCICRHARGSMQARYVRLPNAPKQRRWLNDYRLRGALNVSFACYKRIPA